MVNVRYIACCLLLMMTSATADLKANFGTPKSKKSKKEMQQKKKPAGQKVRKGCNECDQSIGVAFRYLRATPRLDHDGWLSKLSKGCRGTDTCEEIVKSHGKNMANELAELEADVEEELTLKEVHESICVQMTGLCPNRYAFKQTSGFCADSTRCSDEPHTEIQTNKLTTLEPEPGDFDL